MEKHSDPPPCLWSPLRGRSEQPESHSHGHTPCRFILHTQFHVPGTVFYAGDASKQTEPNQYSCVQGADLLVRGDSQ